MTLYPLTNNKSECEEKTDYLHGFSSDEQRRLLTQADFLAPRIFQSGPSLRPGETIVELGCGVGAQTRYLCALESSPRVVGVDHSPIQLEAARSVLAEYLARGQVSLVCAAAERTGLESDSFDLAYLCWILEHVSNPRKVVEEAFRLLKPGGTIWVTEVFNSSLHIIPRQPVITKYWKALNRLQRELGGNPDVGLQLPQLLCQSGFVEIETQPIVFYYSLNNAKERDAMLVYWEHLLLSALPALLRERDGSKIIPTENELRDAFAALRNNDDTVFFYHPIRCVGRKPTS